MEAWGNGLIDGERDGMTGARAVRAGEGGGERMEGGKVPSSSGKPTSIALVYNCLAQSYYVSF